MSYENLYQSLAAAAARGNMLNDPACHLSARLAQTPLDELTADDLSSLIGLGRMRGMRFYRFKRVYGSVPRIKYLLNFLRKIEPKNLLDAGSGRGIFLLPFLNAFPDTPVISLNPLPCQTAFWQDIRRGGVTQLTPMTADLCARPLPARSVDVVTMLETLGAVPDAQAAVEAAVRTARRYVVVCVPSRPRNYSKTTHVFRKQKLAELFQNAGCEKLWFDNLNGWLMLIADVSKASNGAG